MLFYRNDIKFILTWNGLCFPVVPRTVSGSCFPSAHVSDECVIAIHVTQVYSAHCQNCLLVLFPSRPFIGNHIMLLFHIVHLSYQQIAEFSFLYVTAYLTKICMSCSGFEASWLYPQRWRRPRQADIFL